jgi:hypothetical protein
MANMSKEPTADEVIADVTRRLRGPELVMGNLKPESLEDIKFIGEWLTFKPMLEERARQAKADAEGLGRTSMRDEDRVKALGRKFASPEMTRMERDGYGSKRARDDAEQRMWEEFTTASEKFE